jgi:hypothetical protein
MKQVIYPVKENQLVLKGVVINFYCAHYITFPEDGIWMPKHVGVM